MANPAAIWAFIAGLFAAPSPEDIAAGAVLTPSPEDIAMASPLDTLGQIIDYILPDPIEDIRDWLLETADDWIPFTEGQGQIFGWDIPLLSHGDGYDYSIGDMIPFHGPVVKRWMNECTGLHSYMTADGWIHNERKDGTLKSWKPKKPIVIFPTGNKDLRDLLKADKVLSKESDKMAKMMRRRGYDVSRKVSRPRKKMR